jgi:hypothetical protein
MATPSLRTIKIVIAAGMLASALHFADNALAIEQYPEPGWITPLGVVAAWCPVTAIAVVALARKTADRVFFTAAAAYVLILISGLLHYAFAAPMHMAVRSNVTVVAEALTGFALAGTLLWSRVKSLG